MSTLLEAPEAPTDAAGEIFDPELHATKPTGEPALKTDGTFRKKRRDAGERRTAAASSRARSKSTPTAAAMPKALAEQRARHVKAVHDVLAIPTAVLSFVDPVDAYCAAELTPVWAEALADYAQENPQLAVVLDRMASAGGVSALLGVALITGVQFAHNHGKIPAQYARMMGAKPRPEVEAILDQRAEQLRRMERVAGAAGSAVQHD